MNHSASAVLNEFDITLIRSSNGRRPIQLARAHGPEHGESLGEKRARRAADQLLEVARHVRLIGITAVERCGCEIDRRRDRKLQSAL